MITFGLLAGTAILIWAGKDMPKQIDLGSATLFSIIADGIWLYRLASSMASWCRP